MNGQTQWREPDIKEPETLDRGEPSCFDSSGHALGRPAVCPHSFCVLCENRGAPGGPMKRELLEELRARADRDGRAQQMKWY